MTKKIRPKSKGEPAPDPGPPRYVKPKTGRPRTLPAHFARYSFRDDPEAHRMQEIEAERHGMSWNAWAVWALREVLTCGVTPSDTDEDA